jgi:hypothetical protein
MFDFTHECRTRIHRKRHRGARKLFYPGSRPVDPGAASARARVLRQRGSPLAHLDGLDHAHLVDYRRRIVEALIPS